MIRFPIEAKRLLLRPLRLEDAEQLHELYSDPEAMRYLVSAVPETIDESRSWVQAKIDLHERDGGLSLWAVVERESGAVVGDCGLQREEVEGAHELDLGCRIVPRHQRRGYAREASRAALRAAFEQLGAPRVTAQTDLGNEPARRLLDRLGFREAGTTEWLGRAMALYVCDRPPAD